ncbi:NADP-dependent oxidoreductase [Streptomyces sp. H27-D2]|uniref:NADP-dependent oxidoreductase n=1 Tax=Streptomyces sp. H27-D2 TaxID=3046304 RepID=UPI002DBDF9E0|nr:NADP-dependent oxidoreductase [Streptomyces sp. H27-D2]MEC4017330.1 NADP-dependent oxidoreductase [Streptomyces sp. H27-D2]
MSSGVVPEIPRTAREVRLTEHLTGELARGHFDIAEVELSEPGQGEVLVRTDLLPLAAAYQDLMRTDSQLPVPPFQVGERLGGGALGTVVRSSSPDLAVGDVVQSMTGWSEYSSGPAQSYFKVDPDLFPSPAYYLSQGPTAYYGMADIAKAGKDDVVFVSGAAGGVGSLAGQIAKCRGAARVIGSAGSKEKVDYLVNELGFDAAFDYHDGPVIDRLRELAPDGINVFFDNVGGEQFEAAIQLAAPHARFALCGALSAQVGDQAHPRLDLMTAITKHLEIRPFACYHTPDQIMAWTQHFATWVGEGRFVFPHTTVEGGIEAAPDALISLLKGAYKGNVAVRISAAG